MRRHLLLIICSLFATSVVAQITVSAFPLRDVKLLSSRFQRNMQRDSAWIASIPVQSLLHSFRNTAGVFSGKEGGYTTVKRLSGWESLDCDLRGHITGHLLSAMAYLASGTPVPIGSPMGLKADSLVQGLAEVQRQYGSGYLSAFGEGLIDRNIAAKSVWAPFYNHILGQQDTLTSMVCYFTPLMTGGYRLYSTRDSSFWCCVGSGFESHVKYQSSIYFHTDKELYVNLFIPSELNWNGTIVRQETAFPESNKTRLTITNNRGPLTLNLRYPYWTTYMKVNGKKVKPGKDGYVKINSSDSRSIKNASRSLEVEFGMSLREEATKDTPSRVALLYGPIVLGGRLAEVAHPFSNPTKHYDYYTFDYGKHPEMKLGEVKHVGGLRWSMALGSAASLSEEPFTMNNEPLTIQPFYDLQHCRYTVYWKK